jgi:hypothetical protein
LIFTGQVISWSCLPLMLRSSGARGWDLVVDDLGRWCRVASGGVAELMLCGGWGAEADEGLQVGQAERVDGGCLEGYAWARWSV